MCLDNELEDLFLHHPSVTKKDYQGHDLVCFADVSRSRSSASSSPGSANSGALDPRASPPAPLSREEIQLVRQLVKTRRTAPSQLPGHGPFSPTSAAGGSPELFEELPHAYNGERKHPSAAGCLIVGWVEEGLIDMSIEHALVGRYQQDAALGMSGQ
jgi:hypothetical protein